MAVEITAEAITVAEVMAVAMAVEITNLILLIQTNLQEQKVGKIEVMEILLKILNMRMVEAGEKEEFQMRMIYQMRGINNPFPEV